MKYFLVWYDFEKPIAEEFEDKEKLEDRYTYLQQNDLGRCVGIYYGTEVKMESYKAEKICIEVKYRVEG